MAQVLVQSERPSVSGARLLAIAAIVGFIICLIDYFTPHGAIAHQWGTLLVLVSTALMIFASVWIAFGSLGRGLLVTFQVLLILDVLGTGFCAYMLESEALLAFMAVALVGWVWHVAGDKPRISVS